MNEANRKIVGKTVLITGASGGIGSALVRAFLSRGASYVLAASRTLVTASPRVLPIRLDVTDPVNVASLADKCATTVDILVNNAGVNGNSGALEPDSLETAREEMEVNYFGSLSVIRAFAPAMRKRGSGVIVNMLTMLSHVNLPAMGSYCASKSALLSLTQAVRAELASSGVRRLASRLPTRRPNS